MRSNRPQIILIGFWTVICLSACSGLGQSIETALPQPGGVYETVSAQLTSAGTSLPSASPTLTQTARPTLAAGITPSPISATPDARPSRTITPVRPTAACDLAASGKPGVDVTIPDGTHLAPGQVFAKTWRLINAGSCAWTRQYAVVWFSGEVFGAVREQILSSVVQPGQSIDITVDMVAPDQAGLHQSNWKLRNARGGLFGIGPSGEAPFWVRVEVEEVATPTLTPLPTLTATATLALTSKGAVEMNINQAFDLDAGKLATGADDDLAFQKLDAATLQLAPVNGAKMALFGAQLPNDLDCRGAALGQTAIKVADLKIDDYLCVKTSRGLPGYIRVRAVNLKDGKLSLDYLAWAIP